MPVCLAPDLTLECALAGRRTQHQLVTLMGNKQEGGLFAPIVKVARQAIGQSQFNQIRGKAISLHSQGNQTQRLALSLEI